MAFDQSGPRWLGISDLIAEPEGPTFISYKVARSRLDRLRFVTQDPERTFRTACDVFIEKIRIRTALSVIKTIVALSGLALAGCATRKHVSITSTID